MSERREPEYLSPKEAATRLKVHPNTLNKWRIRGGGPPYIRLGWSIRYRWWEVENWLTKRRPRVAAD